MHNPYYAAAVDLQLHGPAGREAAERVLRRAWTCDEDGSWRALVAGLQAPRPAGLEPTVDATARFQLLVALHRGLARSASCAALPAEQLQARVLRPLLLLLHGAGEAVAARRLCLCLACVTVRTFPAVGLSVLEGCTSALMGGGGGAGPLLEYLAAVAEELPSRKNYIRPADRENARRAFCRWDPLVRCIVWGAQRAGGEAGAATLLRGLAAWLEISAEGDFCLRVVQAPEVFGPLFRCLHQPALREAAAEVLCAAFKSAGTPFLEGRHDFLLEERLLGPFRVALGSLPLDGQEQCLTAAMMLGELLKLLLVSNAGAAKPEIGGHDLVAWVLASLVQLSQVASARHFVEVVLALVDAWELFLSFAEKSPELVAAHGRTLELFFEAMRHAVRLSPAAMASATADARDLPDTEKQKRREIAVQIKRLCRLCGSGAVLERLCFALDNGSGQWETEADMYLAGVVLRSTDLAAVDARHKNYVFDRAIALIAPENHPKTMGNAFTLLGSHPEFLAAHPTTLQEALSRILRACDSGDDKLVRNAATALSRLTLHAPAALQMAEMAVPVFQYWSARGGIAGPAVVGEDLSAEQHLLRALLNIVYQGTLHSNQPGSKVAQLCTHLTPIVAAAAGWLAEAGVEAATDVARASERAASAIANLTVVAWRVSSLTDGYFDELHQRNFQGHPLGALIVEQWSTVLGALQRLDLHNENLAVSAGLLFESLTKNPAQFDWFRSASHDGNVGVHLRQTLALLRHMLEHQPLCPLLLRCAGSFLASETGQGGEIAAFAVVAGLARLQETSGGVDAHPEAAILVFSVITKVVDAAPAQFALIDLHALCRVLEQAFATQHKEAGTSLLDMIVSLFTLEGASVPGRALRQHLHDSLSPIVVTGILRGAHSAMPSWMIVPLARALHAVWVCLDTPRMAILVAEAVETVETSSGGGFRGSAEAFVRDLLEEKNKKDTTKFKRLLKATGGKKKGASGTPTAGKAARIGHKYSLA